MQSKYKGNFVRVRNLDQYQHYKDRNPPWVKLHARILEDFDFGRLPDASKAHAILLLPLAARLGNRIPADPEWIGSRIQARSKVDLDLLIAGGFLEVFQDASAAQAPGEQGADSEKSREGLEGETQQTLLGRSVPTAAELEWRIGQVWEAHLTQWRGFFLDDNGAAPASIPTLTKEIKDAIKASLLEHDAALLGAEHREEWLVRSKTRAAGIGIYLDPFMTGQHKDNDRRNGGKRYLEHWRPWKRQTGKGDPVDRFAELYFEVKSVRA